jgi:uncharacterized protein YodC (DUF2158 family)
MSRSLTEYYAATGLASQPPVVRSPQPIATIGLPEQKFSVGEEVKFKRGPIHFLATITGISEDGITIETWATNETLQVQPQQLRINDYEEKRRNARLRSIK